ncbi:MAG: hypothetical protein AB1757_08845 [Acidobacteriota bacterium]
MMCSPEFTPLCLSGWLISCTSYKLHWMGNLEQAIETARHAEQPVIQFIKKAPIKPQRLGIFAASFNPVTTAHLELMQQAKVDFSLDAIIALAGIANADKSEYECAIADRLRMLELVFNENAQTSIAVSSHAFFVDKLDALRAHYDAGTELHFILGFDTFERVLDPEDKYTRLYHRNFANRNLALSYLLAQSRLIVASRLNANRNDFHSLVEKFVPAQFAVRIAFLDFPKTYGEQSATEVRRRLENKTPIAGLVPDAVARYIIERGLYQPSSRQ